MLDQPRNDPGKSIAISPGLLKIAFDLSWKLIPLLWVIFSWYSNQDTLMKKYAAIEDRLEKLQGKYDEQSRALGIVETKIDSLHEQFAQQREFEARTQKH
jgi:hypothetical protein